MNDFNAKVIEEFRQNEGRVGGPFEGAPLVLVHHKGRRTGTEYVNPMVYLPDDADPGVIYVIASKAGAPTHPAWYHNLVAHPACTVQDGPTISDRVARELEGAEREEWWARCVEAFPDYAEYETRTDRIIPVMLLERDD